MKLAISGRVLHGLKYGRKLGFPTANLDRKDWSRKKLKIKYGVYAGCASVVESQKIFKAGIVIGPKDKQGLPKIEAYLLNFSGNLYGKTLRLELNRFLRPYKNFINVDELKKQIAKDVKQIRKL